MSDLLTQALAMEIDKRCFRANLYVNWNEDKPLQRLNSYSPLGVLSLFTYKLARKQRLSISI
ncbi:MAG: hypothetical protein AAF151_24335, partial [Cyanobacteria bacterium J06656_5]